MKITTDAITVEFTQPSQNEYSAFLKDRVKWFIKNIARGYQFSSIDHDANVIRSLCPEALQNLETIMGMDLSEETLYELSNKAHDDYINSLINDRCEERVRRLRAAFARKKNLPAVRFDVRYVSHGFPDVPKLSVESTHDGDGLPESPGVYFIWGDSSVRYVGQSICIKMRCRLDSHERIRPGDRISSLPFPIEELNFAECYYIGICRPPINFTSYTNRGEIIQAESQLHED